MYACIYDLLRPSSIQKENEKKRIECNKGEQSCEQLNDKSCRACLPRDDTLHRQKPMINI